MKYWVILFLLVTWNVQAKPNILTDKILNAQEQKEVKTYLGNKIFYKLTPAKNDYVDNYNRGTVIVEFESEGVPKVGNFVFYKIQVPDGTTIRETNFAQKYPHTIISDAKNLRFEWCNLNNVEIDPTWTTIKSLTIHSRYRYETINGVDYEIYEVERNGEWKETTKHEITDDMSLMD